MDRGRPTKKIFFLLIACLVAVASIGFATYNTKAGLKKPESLTVANRADNLELAQNSLRQKMEADPDLDGLMDWEEVLWETDPHKADTDNDGTKDGDEVRANRNPKIAGPNDAVSSSSAGALGGATASEAAKKVELDNSQTGKIGRDLFATYAEAKRLGLPLDEDIQKKIIDQTLFNKTISNSAKKYSVNEITVSSSIDLKTYGNAIGKAFYAGATSDTTSELDIIQTAFEKKNPDELKKLDPIIDRYTQTVAILLTTPAPQKYSNLHLELLNSTNGLLTDIKGFKEVFKDPIVGLTSIGKYYQDIEQLKSAMALTKSVFAGNGVVFQQTEYGFLFTQVTQ